MEDKEKLGDGAGLRARDARGARLHERGEGLTLGRRFSLSGWQRQAAARLYRAEGIERRRAEALSKRIWPTALFLEGAGSKTVDAAI